MIELSPCKINIGLEITSKRPDGYHNIESVFYPIPLYDIVELCAHEGGDFKYSSSGIIVDSALGNNLLYKAWSIMDKNYSIGGVKVHLHKQIPMGAGLGGGSANAATLMKMINKEFELHLSDKQLILLASEIGADCPFFVKNKTVFAYNTGTEFKEIDLDLSNYYIVIVKAPVSISTKEAYAGVKPQKVDFDLAKLSQISMDNWKDNVFNRFESPNFKKYPYLKSVKQKMYDNGASYVSMSGSGSSIYGLFKEKPNEINFEKDFFVWDAIL